ncbi:DNA-binding protein YbaB [Kibdelosporangium banguiense]|uniref:DNA-binding protein YbaB n=1 Tax=Kibdelosporangium banguiense TaxID=1365924 RepID=A0ABS4TUD8_9PSEU|nr:YbaB/EbfC family nucleoid-associated protein [Kibdelosporangium banguiense]MBP2327988.1 DNA-binding protein YbaB [Kibdelosporangium banguiense]
MDWKQQVAENARRYQELNEQVSRMSVTEVSPDGSVRVTVSANGLMTDLVLRERGYQRPLPQVADEIMACMRRAQARIPDLLQQVMTGALGTADTTTHLLVADARQMFPPPPPRQAWSGHAERADPPPANENTRRPSRAEDDDWQEPVVMEDI